MNNLKQEIIETLNSLLLSDCYNEGRYKKIIDTLLDNDTIILSKKKIENDIITTRPMLDFMFNPNGTIKCTSFLGLKVTNICGIKEDIENLKTLDELDRKVKEIYIKLDEEGVFKKGYTTKLEQNYYKEID